MSDESQRIAILEGRMTVLEAQLAQLRAELGLRVPSGGAGEHPPELFTLIRARRKIEAIKLYRELYGVGLAEAKVAVESLADYLDR